MKKDGLLSAFGLTVNSIPEQKELFTLVTYSILAFFVPFFFKRPLELVYVILNTVLVLAALNLRGKKIIPVILLPGLGALAGGYIFHDFTFVVLSFMPVVWAVDLVFIYLIKMLYLQNNLSFFFTLFISSAVKYLAITTLAYFFIIWNLAPDLFLASMGKVQLLTAVVGGIIAYFIVKTRKQ